MTVRRSLMMQETGLDTSPVILQYGTQYIYGRTQVNEAKCITKIYRYEPSNILRTVVGYNVCDAMQVWNDDTYVDWWNFDYGQGHNAEKFRDCLTANTNGACFSLYSDGINTCYAYIRETGQILFAGKDSIYYGHKNISELN